MLHATFLCLFNPAHVTPVTNLIHLHCPSLMPSSLEPLSLPCSFPKLSATPSFHLSLTCSCVHWSVFALNCLSKAGRKGEREGGSEGGKEGKISYLFICNELLHLYYRPLSHKWECKYPSLVSTLNTTQHNCF